MRKSVKSSAVFSDLLPCDPASPTGRIFAGRAGSGIDAVLSRVPMFEICMMVVFVIMAAA